MEERRSLIRREADQELMRRLEELQQATDHRGEDGAKEARRRLRRAIRHNCSVSIKLVFAHSPGASNVWTTEAVDISGRVLDISTGGANLFTKNALDIGQELRLAITLQNGSAIKADATVRWVKALTQRKGSASGVEFKDMKPEDQQRIAVFLEELDATAGL